MLCFEGSEPVMNDDQATGDMAGVVVFSRAYVPSFFSRARFGSLPSAMNFSASVGSMPSRPRTTRRWMWLFL